MILIRTMSFTLKEGKNGLNMIYFSKHKKR